MAVELNHRIDGSGPHVLLLHAVGMDLTLLEPLAAILAKDFTVLTVDAARAREVALCAVDGPRRLRG